MDVADWLRALGLQRYEATFRANDVDAELLPNLTADDLKEIGITSLGHRRRLLEAIAALLAEGTPADDPVPIIVGDAQPGCCFEPLCYARPRPEEEPARVTALRRLILPVTRLARRGEADRVDGIGRCVTIDAASDASDQPAG